MASHRRSNAAATIASTVVDDPGGYGRVVRRGSRLVEVVEDVDATPEIREICEVSIVLFAFRRRELFSALPKLDRKNRQREYYLNRVIPAMLAAGQKVKAVTVDLGGAMGLNSRAGLAAVEAVVRQRVNARHMANGVTLVDPRATYIDVDVEIGADSVIFPNIVPRAGLAHRREVWHRPVGRDVGFDRGRRLGRAVLGAGWCDRRRGLRGRAIRTPARRHGARRRRPGRQLRRGEGHHSRPWCEGQAPHLPRRRRDRRRGEHRRRDRDGELRRLLEAHDGRGFRCSDRFGYDAGGARDDRPRRQHADR